MANRHRVDSEIYKVIGYQHLSRIPYLHRESVSGGGGYHPGYGLGFRSTLPWSAGWFCTVDLNLYGYIWGTVIAQRFGIANMKSNAHLNLQYKTRPPESREFKDRGRRKQTRVCCEPVLSEMRPARVGEDGGGGSGEGDHLPRSD